MLLDRREARKILERTLRELNREHDPSDLRTIYHWLDDVEKQLEKTVNGLGGTIIWNYQDMYTCNVCRQLVTKKGYNSPEYYDLKEKKICPYCFNSGRTE